MIDLTVAVCLSPVSRECFSAAAIALLPLLTLTDIPIIDVTYFLALKIALFGLSQTCFLGTTPETRRLTSSCSVSQSSCSSTLTRAMTEAKKCWNSSTLRNSSVTWTCRFPTTHRTSSRSSPIVGTPSNIRSKLVSNSVFPQKFPNIAPG